MVSNFFRVPAGRQPVGDESFTPNTWRPSTNNTTSSLWADVPSIADDDASTWIEAPFTSAGNISPSLVALSALAGYSTANDSPTPANVTPSSSSVPYSTYRKVLSYELAIVFKGSGLKSHIPWSLVLYQTGEDIGFKFDPERLDLQLAPESKQVYGFFRETRANFHSRSWGRAVLKRSISVDTRNALEENIKNFKCYESGADLALSQQSCCIQCLDFLGVDPVDMRLIASFRGQNIWAIKEAIDSVSLHRRQ